MYVESAVQPTSERKVTLSDLPSGRAGVQATLKHMRDFVLAAVRDPSQRIRSQAEAILATVPQRNYRREIEALHAFVRDRIRYTKDPVGLERVQDPATTLQTGQGDCDDKATLLAALLQSTGHPSQFIAVGFNHGPLSHVLVEARCGAQRIPLETIIPKPAGWFPPGVTDRLYQKIPVSAGR